MTRDAPARDPHDMLADDTDYASQRIIEELGRNPAYRFDTDDSDGDRWVYSHVSGGHITYFPREDEFVPAIPHDETDADRLRVLMENGEMGDTVAPASAAVVRQLETGFADASRVDGVDGWVYDLERRNGYVRYDAEEQRAALVPEPDWSVMDGRAVPDRSPDRYLLEGARTEVDAVRGMMDELEGQGTVSLTFADNDRVYSATDAGIEVVLPGTEPRHVGLNIWPDRFAADPARSMEIADPELFDFLDVRAAAVGSGDRRLTTTDRDATRQIRR